MLQAAIPLHLLLKDKSWNNKRYKGARRMKITPLDSSLLALIFYIVFMEFGLEDVVRSGGRWHTVPSGVEVRMQSM